MTPLVDEPSAPGGGYPGLAADAIRALATWRADDPAQEALRLQFLAVLARHPDACSKAGPPAHLTASCLVLDADRRHTLLTLHRRASAWFQPGGHLEATDASLAAAAAREAAEETGIDDLTLLPTPVQLDRHDLVGDFGSCRTHLDVRYVALAPPGAPPRRSPESLDLRWWDVDDLPEDTDLTELVRRGLEATAP